MKLPRIAEPLRHRDFRLLWIGQTLTLFGTFVSQVAWPFQMLQLGGSLLGPVAPVAAAILAQTYGPAGCSSSRGPSRPPSRSVACSSPRSATSSDAAYHHERRDGDPRDPIREER